MSIKVPQFTRIITNPLNTHNFLVYIDEKDLSEDSLLLVVSSTTFPSEKMRKTNLHFQGEEIRYPAIPENSGSWSVTIPENEDGKMYKAFTKLKARTYDQKSGKIKTRKWNTAYIIPRNLNDEVPFAVKLHGVWIMGHNPVNLNNSDPSSNWNFEFEFCYQWIEDVPDPESDPCIKKALKIADLDFDESLLNKCDVTANPTAKES